MKRDSSQIRRAVLITLVTAIGVSAGLFYARRHGDRARRQRPSDVILTDLSGRQFKPSDYRNKVVLVNFWAAWCEPCTAEIPQFVALQKKYAAQGLQIVGISIEDDKSALREFCSRNSVNYPVTQGDEKIARAFGGILGLPSTVLIDRQGYIEKRYSGATDFAVLEKDLGFLLRK